jgi:dTDP-4-amino-4,6-dideoxygalactose transaminase
VLIRRNYILGKEVNRFEKRFASYLGTKNVVSCANGTDSLYLALKVLGCTPSSKVLINAISSSYASNAIRRIGATAVYCDIQEGNINYDFEMLSLLLPNVDFIVVTHLFGNIQNIDKIKTLCSNLKIRIVEDFSQAVGSYKSSCQRSGGDIQTFSFYPTKNLGAIGDAGAIALEDSILTAKLKSLRQYGWGEKYFIKYEGGINSRMDEIQAAVLNVKLSRLDKDNLRRRKIGQNYKNLIKAHGIPISIVTELNDKSAPHLFVIKLENKNMRDCLLEHLIKNDIKAEIHYPILDSQQFPHQKLSNFILPNSIDFADTILSLPLFIGLSRSQQLYVIKSIKDFFQLNPTIFKN